MWLINNFRDMEDVSKIFDRAETIANINGFRLKKVSTACTIKYGLFDDDSLVSFLWSLKTNIDNRLMVYEFHTKEECRGYGLGTEIYKYAILQDNKELLSDYIYTSSGLAVWKKLKNIVDISLIDIINGQETIFDVDKLNNNDQIHVILRFSLGRNGRNIIYKSSRRL